MRNHYVGIVIHAGDWERACVRDVVRAVLRTLSKGDEGYGEKFPAELGSYTNGLAIWVSHCHELTQRAPRIRCFEGRVSFLEDATSIDAWLLALERNF